MSHTSGGKTNSIILDSDPNDSVPEGKNEPPFKVGDKFYVEWDGTVNSNSGYFKSVDVRKGYIEDITIENAEINYANVKYLNIDSSYLGGTYNNDGNGKFSSNNDFAWEVNTNEIKSKGFKFSSNTGGSSADSITGACLALNPPNESSFEGESGSYLGVHYADIWEADIAAWRFSYSGGSVLSSSKGSIDCKSLTVSEINCNGTLVCNSDFTCSGDFVCGGSINVLEGTLGGVSFSAKEKLASREWVQDQGYL